MCETRAQLKFQGMNYFNNYYLFSTNGEGFPPCTEKATQRQLGSASGEKRARVEEASMGHQEDR